MAEVNKWFVPSGWFLPGLIAMQAVSIIIPITDALKARSVERKLGRPLLDSQNSSSAEEKNRDYSMASLEYQISNNVDPLLRWAAQKEFTAENIVFLRAVLDFKRKWSVAANHGHLTSNQLRERYEEAALIYFTLVNQLTAKFNINVDHRIYRELEQMFAGVSYAPLADDNSSTVKFSKTENIITPWDDIEEFSVGSRNSDEAIIKNDVDKLYPIPITEIRASIDDTLRQSSLGLPHIHIPSAFSLEVFDKAYHSIRHDVFLNTWMRYEARFSKPRLPQHPAAFRMQTNITCPRIAMHDFVRRASDTLFPGS
jgi:hypothetical protein